MLLRIIDEIGRTRRLIKHKKAYKKWASEQKAKGLPSDKWAYRKALLKKDLNVFRIKRKR